MEIFKNLTIHDQISEDIKSFIEKKANCDVSIHCKDGGKVFASKLLLASWSNFWKTLLSDFDQATIILPDMDKTVVRSLIDFLTHGKYNVQGVKESSRFLEYLEALIPEIATNGEKIIIEDIPIIEQGLESEYEEFEVKESYICNICLKYFSRKEACDRHKKNVHFGMKSFPCKICAKILKTKEGLEAHLKMHKKSIMLVNKCPQCGKIYKNYSDLYKHCRSLNHSFPDNIPFPSIHETECKICMKKVTRIDHHKKTHHSLNSRKFTCSKCDFITNRKDSLYRHERQVHKMHNKNLAAISEKITSKGKTTCFDCGKSFDKVVDAEDHMAQSNCEGSKCNLCGKMFNVKSNLLQHIREIHGEATHTCSVCQKEFKQKRSRDRHMKTCKKKS